MYPKFYFQRSNCFNRATNIPLIIITFFLIMILTFIEKFNFNGPIREQSWQLFLTLFTYYNINERSYNGTLFQEWNENENRSLGFQWVALVPSSNACHTVLTLKLRSLTDPNSRVKLEPHPRVHNEKEDDVYMRRGWATTPIDPSTKA